MNIKMFSQAYVHNSLGKGGLSRNTDSGMLPENYFEYLNSAVRRHADPRSQTFWKDLQNWLMRVSRQSMGNPKASNYRDRLEPYLLRRVNLTVDRWNVVRRCSDGSDMVYICLCGVHLNHVQGDMVGNSPDIYISHMHACVSASWLACAESWPDEPLSINGILYEYTSSKRTRNIGVWPVTLIPRGRKAGIMAA